MNLLSLDPSSTTTGYAVLNRTPKLTLVEAGRLRGKRTASAVSRVLAMRGELLRVLAEFVPSTVLIEMPLGLQYTRHEQRKSGMAVWAGAAWSLWMVCVEWAGLQHKVYGAEKAIVPIANTEWTRGMDKDARQALVRTNCPKYSPKDDPGRDVSDAIALGMWWCQRNQPARAEGKEGGA